MSLSDDAKGILEEMRAEDGLRISIALFGQPGAGKSALINRLVGQNLAPEGVETNKTTERNDYEWNGLTLVDLPGFDTKLFPAETYLARFKIMEFDILLCVFHGKWHAADTQFFKEVSTRGKVCLFVCNKRDALSHPVKEPAELEHEICEDLERQVGSPQPVYFTSCRNNTGLDELEAAVQAHLDPAKQKRWVLAAKAYSKEFLAEKKRICERRVYLAAGASAAVAAVPTPGADVAVDVAVLLSLFRHIRKTYGLTDSVLEMKDRGLQALAPIINEIIGYASNQGVPAATSQAGEGQRPAGFFEQTADQPCQRPGCYTCFAAAPRSPHQRFCCPACRQALRRVRHREVQRRRRRRHGARPRPLRPRPPP